MSVRKFSTAGMTRYSEYLDSAARGETAAPDEELLQSEWATTSLNDVLTFEASPSESRYAVASRLLELFASLPGGSDDDPLVWAWLSCSVFDQLCPRSSGGQFLPGERARWYPDLGNYKRYYRHLLAGPYFIARQHVDALDRVSAVLCQPVLRPGDVVGQLAARQDFVQSPIIMDVATRLYVDRASGGIRRGAGGKGPGSARRLSVVLSQLDLTWDLHQVPVESLLELLPAEFDRYRRE